MGLISPIARGPRWGKFRPYLLFGAIPYGICGYLMFAGPDLSANGKIVYAFITYALMLMSYHGDQRAVLRRCSVVISPSSRTRTVASTFRFVGAFAGRC
jgi:GPH family glycoside/pentoside/hexuronide:cation symporter